MLRSSLLGTKDDGKDESKNEKKDDQTSRTE